MQKELKTRLVTAAVLVTALISILILANFLPFPKGSIVLAFLACVLSLVAAWEFAAFSVTSLSARLLVSLVVLSPVIISVIIALLLLNALSAFLIGFFVGLVILFWYCMLTARVQLERFSRAFAADGVAYLLIGGGGAALVGIAFSPQAVNLIVYLVSVVAINDSAAYFVGSKVGGPKLAPAISPKKTLSGSAAGVIVGMLCGVVLGRALHLGNSFELCGLSLLVVLSAQVGDLLESYLKRLYGVKDSGNTLPGHGGILDRIDGILGAAPLCIIWAELFR